MALGSASHSADVERAELETVVAALERSPRLAKLLNFVGQKYLDGQAEEITEYNIATEVFGRAKTSFDSTDSVARTEIYRLRKKLKEYYEAEGRDHALQILIPFRTYAPEFVRRDSLTPSQQSDIDELDVAVEPEQAGEIQDLAEVESTDTSPNFGFRISGKRALLYGTALAVLALISVGAIRLWKHSASDDPSAKSKSNSPEMSQSREANTTPPTPANAASVPVRLLAGYNGSPQIDSAGMRWYPDNYFHLGGTMRRSEASIERTSDPMIFDYWRNGNFSYDIPLAGGPYELHLYFVSQTRDLSTFSVFINHQLVLQGFDINDDAMGADVADERIFRDIFPDKDGVLHLDFNNEQGVPALNGIELVPGTPHKQLPIRIVTQPTSVIDHNGNVWHPDTYFAGGHPRDQRSQVSGTSDPDLYTRERYGHFNYAIPVDTRDRYTLVLHFAELYFGPQAPGGGGVGNRLFRVLCNGESLLDNFDIYKEGGGLHAVTKTFYHLRPTAQGKLNLMFEPIRNNATVSAIEVIDEEK